MFTKNHKLCIKNFYRKILLCKIIPISFVMQVGSLLVGMVVAGWLTVWQRCSNHFLLVKYTYFYSVCNGIDVHVQHANEHFMPMPKTLCAALLLGVSVECLWSNIADRSNIDVMLNGSNEWLNIIQSLRGTQELDRSRIYVVVNP